MSTRRYSVQSLNGRTNQWNEIYLEPSLVKAKTSALEWELGVKKLRSDGKGHLSDGVRIVKPGDQGDPLYVRMWGAS